MINRGLILILTAWSSTAWSQEMTAHELLDASIKYHDPGGYWEEFSAVLDIELTMPGKASRHSKVTIDLPNEYFALTSTTEGDATSYVYDNGECKITRNGKVTFTDEEVKKYGLTCDRASMMSDYYAYLYGLPMKLKDSGTILSPIVKRKEFLRIQYDVLKVTYEQEVGGDIWYFYFDPESHALEAYQFYHNESKNDGEYILLEDVVDFNNMKIPQKRTWYYNKDGKRLGTDHLKSVSQRE